MLAYLIRLDDACPTMNASQWKKTEDCLDTYNIKPIIGIIPDNMDPEFNWDEDEHFWEQRVGQYVKKGWVIAQHGCHHLYQQNVKSEFSGLSYYEQQRLIDKGYKILLSHNCKPTCFFAPAHSFDDVTIDVCRDSGYYKFISDGKALKQFNYRKILFIPSLFDTPHKIIPFGIYTFVFHPNNMTDRDIKNMEDFIKEHRKYFCEVKDLISKVNLNRNRSFLDLTVACIISILRGIRNQGGGGLFRVNRYLY